MHFISYVFLVIHDAVVVDLPEKKTDNMFMMPREKPLPKKKAQTKWEAFAETKGKDQIFIKYSFNKTIMMLESMVNCSEIDRPPPIFVKVGFFFSGTVFVI